MGSLTCLRRLQPPPQKKINPATLWSLIILIITTELLVANTAQVIITQHCCYSADHQWEKRKHDQDLINHLLPVEVSILPLENNSDPPKNPLKRLKPMQDARVSISIPSSARSGIVARTPCILKNANHFGEPRVLLHDQGVCHVIKRWTEHT